MAARDGAAGGTSSARRRRPPGLRPGVLQDPGPPLVEAVTVGYVAAGVPLLGAPSLADSSAEVIDGSTLSFLLQRALEVKRKEEEEVVEAAELVELEEKLAAAEERLLEVFRRDLDEGTPVARQTWSTLSRVEQFAVRWFMAKDAVGKKRVKRKNGGRGRLARASLGSCSAALHDVSFDSLPSFGWFLRPLVSGSHVFYSVLARGVQYVVFSASWFDSGYMLLTSLHGGFCMNFLFLYVVTRILRSILVLLSVARVWWTWCPCFSLQKTADFPQLQFIAGRRFPCRGAEADSNGLDVQHTIEFPQLLLYMVVDVPVVQVVFLECRTVRRSWSCNTLTRWSMSLLAQFIDGLDVPVIMQRRCLATVKMPHIQFIAGAGGHFSSPQRQALFHWGMAVMRGFFGFFSGHFSRSVHLDVERQVSRR